jgi:3-hydroxybutyryl-CoA dehydratase
MDILRKLGVEIGLRRRQTRIITATDIASFADLSGDYNPIHMDEEYAKKTLFGGRIAHGVISLGLLSAAMAQLPGLPIFMSQSVKFVKPVSIGDTITASVEVIDMRPDKGIVTLKNTCANQKGEVVIEGEAKCRLFERPV